MFTLGRNCGFLGCIGPPMCIGQVIPGLLRGINSLKEIVTLAYEKTFKMKVLLMGSRVFFVLFHSVKF